MYLELFLGGIMLVSAVLGGVFLSPRRFVPLAFFIACSFFFFAWFHEMPRPTFYAQSVVFLSTLVFAVLIGQLIRGYIQDLEETKKENSQLIQEIIYSFVTAIDAKDPYLHNHSQNVAYYAKVIAEKLELPKDKCYQVATAGIFHDIGKINLDTAILQKPGKLSPEEWQVMKKHPELGAFILRRVSQMQDILPAIKYHHRRFDGNGYPDDCPLEEVPLEARIIEVADAFDAMTTDRPYRQALTPEEAYAELKKHSGKQFDPQVVKAFQDSEVALLEDIQTERIAGFPISFSIP